MSMSLSSPPDRGSPDRGAVGRGTALVAVAVLLGIVVLQATDDGGSPLGSGADRATTTTMSKGTSTAPSQAKRLKVLVLNASTKKGAARALADKLKGQKFDVLDPGDTPAQAETSVYFKEGFEGDAGRVGASIYDSGTSPPIKPLPTPSPFETGEGTVIVVIGADFGTD